MPKARSSSSIQRTRLGERLRQFREGNGRDDRPQLLRELAEQLKGQGWKGTEDYISKVENGRIKVPAPQFFDALAKAMGASVEELKDLCMPASAEQLPVGPPPGIPRQAPFKLVFGHSLWGAPFFDAAFRGYIKLFDVASFAEAGSELGIASSQLNWIKPDVVVPTPRPGATLAALSAANVVDLLRKGKADVGAIPGTVAEPLNDLAVIATVVDSVAGCTFVCEDKKLKVWQKQISTLDENLRGQRSSSEANLPDAAPVSTLDLCRIFLFEKKAKREFRVAVEENTVAFEYLKDACEQDRENKISVKEVNWNFRSKDLAVDRFSKLKEDCKARDKAELIGAIVWEPHATWMRILEDSKTQLRKIPLHFAPGELGRPKHYTYVIVVPRDSLMDRNVKRQELVNAIAKLMPVLETSADTLNNLSPNRPNEATLERLARYYGFIKPDGSPLIPWTLDAVGNILYSIRWTVEGRDLVR